MKKRVVILGSTGSVGSNTLRILAENRTLYEVVGLAACRNLLKLMEQVSDFEVDAVSIADERDAEILKKGFEKYSAFTGFLGIGAQGHRELIEKSRPDIVIAAMSGTHSLQACLSAIELGVPTLGVANKEILVMAGDFVNDALKKSVTKIIPVDSEHSAIFQCLMGNSQKSLKKILMK